MNNKAMRTITNTYYDQRQYEQIDNISVCSCTGACRCDEIEF